MTGDPKLRKRLDDFAPVRGDAPRIEIVAALMTMTDEVQPDGPLT
jgi:hypothetical protein